MCAETPLVYTRDGDSYVIVASKVARRRTPPGTTTS